MRNVSLLIVGLWVTLLFLNGGKAQGEDQSQGLPLQSNFNLAKTSPTLLKVWAQGYVEFAQQGKVLSLTEINLRKVSLFYFQKTVQLDNIPVLLKGKIEAYQPFVKFLAWVSEKKLMIPSPLQHDSLSSFFLTLVSLDLEGLGITSLAKEDFTWTPALRHLNIAHNQLTKIPDSLGIQLPYLEDLDIRGNPLKEFPRLGIFGLRRLHLDAGQRQSLWEEYEDQDSFLEETFNTLFKEKL